MTARPISWPQRPERPQHSDLIEDLARFRAKHPLRHLYFADATFDYYTGGNGRQAMMLLTGEEGIGECWFKHIAEFESDYRIIAPNYPRLRRLDDLVDGLAAAVEGESPTHTVVIGAGFGGMVAQCLVRRHPAMFNRLILCNTTFPNPTYALSIRRNLTLLRILPWRLVRSFVKRRITGSIDAPRDERNFWRVYFDEQFDRHIDKELINSTQHCALDFAARSTFAPGDLAKWRGRVLIVESETDPFFKGRVSLKALYPKARVHTFFGAGPLPAISRREQFNSVVRSFLREAM